MEFIRFLFDTANWPPRWHCGTWTDTLGWIHILSDLAIFGAYLAIPCILLYFCKKRQDIPFQKILILFGLFIVFCGTGHLIEASIFWYPVYRFDGLVKLSTATVSWITVIAMIPFIPRVLNFPKLEELNEILESNLKETRERLQLAFEGTGGGLWDWNVLTNEMQISHRFAEYLGYRKDEIKPSIDEYLLRIHPEDKELIISSLHKHLKDHQPFHVEHRLLNSKGDYCWFLSVGQAQWNENDQAIRMVGSINNISQQIESRKQLIQSNELLKNEITTRKNTENQLELVIENLKHANRELEQFTHLASHDMQEPLRTISSFVQLFEKKYAGKLDEDADQYIEFIVNATARMRKLINDLLEFSRLGKKLSLETVDCNESLNEALADLQTAIVESNAKITSSVLPIIKGYKLPIKRLFQNLLSNAMKFHKKDIPSEITITCTEKENEYLFAIKDNGIGIEEQYIPKLFVIFQRLHGINEYPGTGIGLAICNKIVVLHGGKIWVESQIDEGSTFYFTLPKVPPN